MITEINQDELNSLLEERIRPLREDLAKIKSELKEIRKSLSHPKLTVSKDDLIGMITSYSDRTLN